MTTHDHIDDLFDWADAHALIGLAGESRSPIETAADASAEIDHCADTGRTAASATEGQASAMSPTTILCLGHASGDTPPAEMHRSIEAGPLDGVTTAADALEALGRIPDLSSSKKTDIRSAVRAIAKATRRDPRDIALEPRSLVPLLKSIHPARHRWSGKRWANIRSALRAIAISAGHVVDERTLPVDPAGPWARLLVTLPNAPKTCCLRRFARLCSTQGISPAEVDLGTLQAFRQWLEERTYELNASSVAATVRLAWNKSVAVVGTEGARTLPALGSSRRISLPVEMLPPQLVSDIAAYGAARRSLDPFTGPDVRRSSEATIRDRENRLTYAASLLLRTGIDPQRVNSLRDLVTPENLRAVLQQMLTASTSNQPGMNHLHLALAMIDAGVVFLQLPEDEIARLHEIRKRIRPPKPGLSKRASQRLQPFDDQRVRAKLLALPDKLFAAAELQRKAGLLVRAAETHERAVALAILLVQPLRRRALAAIELDAHLLRDDRGAINRLCLPGAVIKNGVSVDAPIDQVLARHIDRHIKMFRPSLRGAEKSRHLFPAPDGRARTPDAIARGIKKVATQVLGVEFSVGLVRHIVATMLYESNPQAGPVAQRLLGHTSVKTTELMYGHLTTRSAHDTWARIVEKQRRRADVARGKR